MHAEYHCMHAEYWHACRISLHHAVLCMQCMQSANLHACGACMWHAFSTCMQCMHAACMHQFGRACTHEEADTRIFLHLEDAVKQGYSKVTVRTVDTDVVVLGVTSAHRLNITELWIAFGTGKHFRFLPAHKIARELGSDRCVAMPMCHAFTGCDTVSYFGGKGIRLHGTRGMYLMKSHQHFVHWHLHQHL
jgi:hypothetical protein